MQAVYSTQTSSSVASLVGEDHIQNAEEYEDVKGKRRKQEVTWPFYLGIMNTKMPTTAATVETTPGSATPVQSAELTLSLPRVC